MKRVVSSSIASVFVLLLLIGLYFGVRFLIADTSSPLSLVPSDAAVVVAYNPARLPPNEVFSNRIAKTLSELNVGYPFGYQLSWADSVSEKNSKFRSWFRASPIYLSLQQTASGTPSFLFIKEMNPAMSEQQLDRLFNGTGNSKMAIKSLKGSSIRTVRISDSLSFTYTFVNNLFVGSPVIWLVEESVRRLKSGVEPDSRLSEWETMAAESGLSIAVNFNNASTFLGLNADASSTSFLKQLKSFSGWNFSAARLIGDTVSFQGILKAAPIKGGLDECLLDQRPVRMEMLDILPVSCTMVRYFGFSNLDAFRKRLNDDYFDEVFRKERSAYFDAANQKLGFNVDSSFTSWIGNEMAVVNTFNEGGKDGWYSLFRLKNRKNATDHLLRIMQASNQLAGQQTPFETYNGHMLGLIRYGGLLHYLMGDLFPSMDNCYFAVLDNYVVFGRQASALRVFIDDYERDRLNPSSSIAKQVPEEVRAYGNVFLLVRPMLAGSQIVHGMSSEIQSAFEKNKNAIGKIATVSFCLKNLKDRQSTRAAIIAAP